MSQKNKIIERYGIWLADLVCILVIFISSTYIRFGNFSDMGDKNSHFAVCIAYLLFCTMYNFFADWNSNFMRRGLWQEFVAVAKYNFTMVLVVGMLMYFMVIIYGQDVARNVAAEKTSKLMETMLSFVTPKALIFGKILAGFVMSVVQVLIWVACGVGGYLVGSVIAKSINPDYTDYVSKAFSAIRAVTGQSAMTLVPVILALAVFFLGLLLYYAIAGIGGSMVTKPEEVASASAVLTFPVLIFWLVGYFAALNQNESMLTVCRYIPFAAPFTVTAEILTGKVSVWGGLIVVAEMLAVTLLLVWIAGKIYRGLVLYNGEKLSIRKMIGVVRGK